MVVSVRSAMVSRFCVRPTSKTRTLKIIQTCDHETWSIRCHVGIHVDFTFVLHSQFHILRWSLKRSVKQTWTGSAFSTNESAWSVMVMCEVASRSRKPNFLLVVLGLPVPCRGGLYGSLTWKDFSNLPCQMGALCVSYASLKYKFDTKFV